MGTIGPNELRKRGPVLSKLSFPVAYSCSQQIALYSSFAISPAATVDCNKDQTSAAHDSLNNERKKKRIESIALIRVYTKMFILCFFPSGHPQTAACVSRVIKSCKRDRPIHTDYYTISSVYEIKVKAVVRGHEWI